MKKTILFLIVGAFALSATGCAAQLSTAETCAQIKAGVMSGYSSNADNDQKTKLLTQIKPIEEKASDALKGPLQSIVDYLQESVKANPDSSKLSALEAKYSDAGATFGRVCGM